MAQDVPINHNIGGQCMEALYRLCFGCHVDACDLHRQRCCTLTRSSHKTIGDRAFPVAAARVWNMLPPAITSLPSLRTFKHALKTELFRRSYDNHTSGNSSIDTSLIHDIYCSPEVLFETCVTLEFADGDDDDGRWLGADYQPTDNRSLPYRCISS